MLYLPRTLAAAGMAVLFLAGCQSSAQVSTSTTGPASIKATSSPGDAEISRFLVPQKSEPNLTHDQAVNLLRRHVRYLFVLYQENRSFDSYFGTFPGVEGIFSQPAECTPGFFQDILNTDGTTGRIQPFRIGPNEFAADTDDVDHSHSLLVKKMDVVDGKARMDRFALTEEEKYASGGAPSLQARQFGELTMAYMDGDTIPFLWRYANRFVIFDHIFQSLIGPSTPGNLAIIAAQGGQTQAALHPDEAWQGNGNRGKGEPVVNDEDPFWGSPEDSSMRKMPVNPKDFPGYGVQLNQTYATLPLSLAGGEAARQTASDPDGSSDLSDVAEDIGFLTGKGGKAVPWGWFEEGFDREPNETDAGPTDANGVHASYITHHNGPQYFGYIVNSPPMAAKLRGLGDFFSALRDGTLPGDGGVFYVKGGYRNIFGMKPVDPDPAVQESFLGDDDHPAYSDAQISEALIAKAVNAIARSRYWAESAIIITWDDSEGDYDHVPPPIRSYGPDGSALTMGPRVPLLVISPYSRAHAVVSEQGDHGSVVKLVDALFGLTPLAELPAEKKGREAGQKQFGQSDWGPDDSLTEGVSDLVAAFDSARLQGAAPPLPSSYAEIPDDIVATLPQASGFGLRNIGIIPVDRALGVRNLLPEDFNPRPRTNPTQTK